MSDIQTVPGRYDAFTEKSFTQISTIKVGI